MTNEKEKGDLSRVLGRVAKATSVSARTVANIGILSKNDGLKEARCFQFQIRIGQNKI